MNAMRSAVKAILFDLDGTLVDTIEDIRLSLASALELESLPAPSATLTRQAVGRGLMNALKDVLAAYNHPVDESRLALLYETMISYYRSHYAVYSKPYEGIVELLVRLSEEGVLLGVFSNKEDGLTKSIVSTLLPSLPFVWVRGLKEGMPRKPDRSGIDYFCRTYAISNEQLLYIGDSEVDYQTAQNAQCPNILVSWGFRPKEGLMKLDDAVIVDTVQELEETIHDLQREGTEKQG